MDVSPIPNIALTARNNTQRPAAPGKSAAAAPLPDEATPPADYRDRYQSLTGVSLRTCPVCTEGHMIETVSWRRGCASPPLLDTS